MKYILSAIVGCLIFLFAWEFVPMHYTYLEDRQWSCKYDTYEKNSVCQDMVEHISSASGVECSQRVGYSPVSLDSIDFIRSWFWVCEYKVPVRKRLNP